MNNLERLKYLITLIFAVVLLTQCSEHTSVKGNGTSKDPTNPKPIQSGIEYVGTLIPKTIADKDTYRNFLELHISNFCDNYLTYPSYGPFQGPSVDPFNGCYQYQERIQVKLIHTNDNRVIFEMYPIKTTTNDPANTKYPSLFRVNEVPQLGDNQLIFNSDPTHQIKVTTLNVFDDDDPANVSQRIEVEFIRKNSPYSFTLEGIIRSNKLF